MPRKTKMNNLTNPELVARVNSENIQLKNDFLDYLRSLQRSPDTIRGYNNDLEIFFVWNMQRNKDKLFADVTKRDLVAYQNWLLNDNGNSPSRVRRLKSSISSLSNYIEAILDEEKEFAGFRSIVRKIESPVNQPVREKTIFTDEQLDTLLKILVEKKSYEKACALALAMFSGRRKSELVRFKVSDFSDDNLICGGSLYKTSDTIKTKGLGLGKYIYCYTLAKHFKPYLDLWLEERKRTGIESEWLFPLKSDTAQQMKPETLNSWAITFGNMLGLDFYWHALRHYFTTHLARSGLPDSVIQEILGWSSADMVTLYKDMTAEEQFEQYFDGDGVRTAKQKQISDI